MKATWERSEQQTLITLCNSALDVATNIRNDVKSEIKERDSAIDKLPWYKRIFEIKLEENTSMFIDYEILAKLRFYNRDVNAINNLIIKIKSVFKYGASNIVLNDEEIGVLVEYLIVKEN